MLIPLLLISGLVLLIVGAELLVRGASQLAAAAGLSSLVIGLTVVAFGTSAPEMAVSIKASLTGQADIALGNVVGSNAFNVLFILGLSALIVPLTISSQLVRLDVPVMIAVSVLTWLFALNGVIGRIEGLILFAGIVAYTGLLLWLGREKASPEETDSPPPAKAKWTVSILLVVVGLALLVLGARWLVLGAVDLARLLGVSELIIGLTLVAAGTSLPELATSVLASIRGQRDIAVGNIVGSNIFNILAVLGASAAVGPHGVQVAESALRFDIPIMVATAIVCLPIFFTGGRISRGEGLMFLLYYFAYVAFLVWDTTTEQPITLFRNALLWFAFPLTALGLLWSLWASLKQRKKDTLPA